MTKIERLSEIKSIINKMGGCLKNNKNNISKKESERILDEVMLACEEKNTITNSFKFEISLTGKSKYFKKINWNDSQKVYAYFFIYSDRELKGKESTALLKSDSMYDIVEFMFERNITPIDTNYYGEEKENLFKFIKRYFRILRRSKDLDKLNALLDSCDSDNIELVKQLINA